MKNKQNLEVRIQETRMTSNGDMMVSGYVNMTNTLSYELGFVDKFVEKISPGAFTRAIERAKSDGQDIDFLAEHDDTIVLASTKNDTLNLQEDEKGLYMEARIINTSSGRDYYEMIKSGIITNMSFGFYAQDDSWRSVRSDLYERTINELDLFEVSAVRRPAYAASSISGRGLNMSDETVPDYIKEEVGMEERSNEEKLFDAITELTNEVRELRGAMKQEQAQAVVHTEEDNEERADGKDKDKEDKAKKAKKAQKDQEEKEGNDSFDEKDKDADKEETDMDDTSGSEKKVDSDKNDKIATKEKDNEEEVEKARKKKEEEDAKKRSYSLLREEFKNLRGGNE